MANQPGILGQAELAKCEGIGCAYKTSCGRHLRPEAEGQLWAAFYALSGDDCEAYEVIGGDSEK